MVRQPVVQLPHIMKQKLRTRNVNSVAHNLQQIPDFMSLSLSSIRTCYVLYFSIGYSSEFYPSLALKAKSWKISSYRQ